MGIQCSNLPFCVRRAENLSWMAWDIWLSLIIACVALGDLQRSARTTGFSVLFFLGALAVYTSQIDSQGFPQNPFFSSCLIIPERWLFYNSLKTIWHWSDYAPGLEKYETAARLIPQQAAKGEILLKCKFFQGFVPEACRVKLAFKHIGILMSWGASTSNLLRITAAMRRNWLLVHNAYICIGRNATFLQFTGRLRGHTCLSQHKTGEPVLYPVQRQRSRWCSAPCNVPPMLKKQQFTQW